MLRARNNLARKTLVADPHRFALICPALIFNHINIRG